MSDTPCYTLPGLRGDESQDTDSAAPRALAGVLWYPPAEQKLLRVNFTSGGMRTPVAFLPHCQVGNGGLYRLFSNPERKASTHLWLSKDGRFEQYVRFTDRAWAQGPGNGYCISCEVEGFPGERYTEMQLTGLAEFFAWGHGQWDWPVQVANDQGVGGIGAHRSYMPTECPGGIRAGQRWEILTRVREILGGQAAGPGRYAAMPELREGSTGPDVVTLQNACNIVCRHEDPADLLRLDPDGDFGPATARGVRAVQHMDVQWAGPIEADGVCGPATWAKIGEILTGMGRVV